MPSIEMISPQRLHLIRARFPATFVSGTLNLVAQEEQLTIIENAPELEVKPNPLALTMAIRFPPI